MMEMIENQVYLAQGAYVKVIGKSEGILAVCQGLDYGLVALHVQIQTAAAYEKMGKHGEARAILRQALSDASKDTKWSCLLWKILFIWNRFLKELCRRSKKDS